LSLLFICQTNHEARPGKATRNPAREKEVLKKNAYGLWLDEISSVKIPSAREAVRICNRNSSPFVRYSHSGGQKEIITAVMPVFHNVSFFHRQTDKGQRETDRQGTDRDRQTGREKGWHLPHPHPPPRSPHQQEHNNNNNTHTVRWHIILTQLLSRLLLYRVGIAPEISGNWLSVSQNNLLDYPTFIHPPPFPSTPFTHPLPVCSLNPRASVQMRLFRTLASCPTQLKSTTTSPVISSICLHLPTASKSKDHRQSRSRWTTDCSRSDALMMN